MTTLTAPGAGQSRILFVSNVAWFFASHRLQIALGAREAGYDVHVAAQPDGSEALDAARIPLHPLALARGEGQLASDVALLRALTRLYRGLRPSLVHHVTLKPVLYGSLAARRVGVPWTVNAISGLGTLSLAEGARAAIRRGVVTPLLRAGSNRESCRVIFQNRDDRAAWVRERLTSDERSVLIPGSGVDLTQFDAAPEPPGVPVVLLPARLIRDKGIGEFVDAAAMLRERGVAARFALVGAMDPDNASAVPEATVRDWVARGLVEWWGHRTDMAEVLRAASVVCLPSYREGLPKTLQEAAASGRAVVTTDVPGCRDAVRPGVSGLLVPPRDARALATALGALLNDPARRAAFGAAGRALAEREFGVDRVVRDHLVLYRNLLGSCAS